MILRSKCNKCVICRKLFDLSDLQVKQTDRIDKQSANVFTMWKKECATTLCHVLFDKNTNYFVNYFNSAIYCPCCEQLVRDVTFVWKQIQALQNRFQKLSAKLYKRLDLNYQLIEEKSQPEVVQERISFLFDASDFPDKVSEYSYDEVLEIIYSAVSRSDTPNAKAFGNSNSSLDHNFETLPDSENSFRADAVLRTDFENINIIDEHSDLELIEDWLLNISEYFPSLNEDVEDKTQTECENFNSSLDDKKKQCDENNNCEINESLRVVEKCEINKSNSSHDHDVKQEKQAKGKCRVQPEIKKQKSTNKFYYCNEEGCTKRFTNEKNKQLHIRKVHKGESKPYKCTNCLKSFTTSEHLKRHEKTVHEEGRVLKTNICKYCGTKYIALTDLTVHYSNSHQQPNPFSCAFCPEVYQNCEDLTKHTKDCHLQPNTCDICDKVFINYSSLERHHLKSHKGKNLWLRCSVCGQKYACKAWLDIHMLKHNQTKLFQCEVCGESFKYSQQLKSHIVMHDPGVFECKVCQITLTTLYELKVHELTHRGTVDLKRKQKEKRKEKGRKDLIEAQKSFSYECKFCGKGYNMEEELKDHYAVSHLGSNPFTCAFCPEIYSNSVDLGKHVKSVHPEPNAFVGKFKCNTCDRYFSSSKSLRAHCKSHLDPSLLLKCHLCPAVFKLSHLLRSHLDAKHSEEKKYVCEKCGKSYKRSDCLYTHSKTHDESHRKYKCKICDKKFFAKAHCKAHEITHTNLKEFVCQVCGKAFNRDCNLNEHLKIHAGIDTRRRVFVRR